MPMPIPPFLPTQLRYCYKNIVSATRAKIAKITELKSLLPLRLLLLPFKSEITKFFLKHLSVILFYLIPFKAKQIVLKLLTQIFFRREFE